MNEEIKKIAGDLEQLLESTKVKPVVVTDEKPQPVNEEQSFAKEVLRLALKHTPDDVSPMGVGYCIRQAARLKSEELGVSEKALMEEVVNHLLDITENLNIQLDEDVFRT